MLADSVKVCETAEQGRFLVATRDIAVGEQVWFAPEILFSNISQVAKEAAAAAVLLPSLRPSHCATCLVQLPAQPCLLPCPRCPAVFCGKLCREQTGHALLCRMEHTMDEVLEQVLVDI